MPDFGGQWRKLKLHFFRSLRRRANRARDEGRWDDAVRGYRAYLAKMPDDFAIWVQFGHALSETRDFDGALVAYQRAYLLNPEDADLLLCWGHCCKKAGQYADAFLLYRQSFARDNNDSAENEILDLQQRRGLLRGVSQELVILLSRRSNDDAKGGVAGWIDAVVGTKIHGTVLAGETGQAEIIDFETDEGFVGRAITAPSTASNEEIPFSAFIDVQDKSVVWGRRVSDGRLLEGSPFLLDVVGRHGGVGPPPAWFARMEIIKPFGVDVGRETVVFVTHSPNGALKPHVAAFLRAFACEGISILLVVAADSAVHVQADVFEMASGIIARENKGLDFAAWAHVLRLYPDLYATPLLYLANDSMFGPSAQYAFHEIIERGRGSESDLIGLTESHEYRWHLQTYFLAVKPGLLSSLAFQSFLGSVRLLAEKDAVIRAYEVRLAGEMQAKGHSVEALFPSPVAGNPVLHGWRSLIASGFPFIKLLLLRGEFPAIDRQGWREELQGAGFNLQVLDETLAASAEKFAIDDTGKLSAHSPITQRMVSQTLKVAFYGPWNYDNGLGAASRGIITTLRHLGVQLNLHPITKPFHVHRPLVPPVDIRDFEGPADVAIVHLNPDSWFLLSDEQRADIGSAYRRIGYWVWEMEHIPDAWYRDFGSVDRIWAPSHYCADVFTAHSDVLVDVIPHTVPVKPLRPRDRARAMQALGIATERRVILYIFDGSSYLVRKNPVALVEAFAASGLAERGWTLVLKTKHLLDRPVEGQALLSLAKRTADVVLIDRRMSSSELGELLNVADIYASPHSSEGFGLTIAEAMAAGKSVVATNFGGSVDFLDRGTGYPVEAREWELTEDFGHYTQGGRWAKVDQNALADALIEAATGIEGGKYEIGEAARARIAETLSYDAVGRRIAISFEDLLTDRSAAPTPVSTSPDLTTGVAIESMPITDGLWPLTLTMNGAPAEAPLKFDANDADWVIIAPEGSRLSPVVARKLRAAAEQRPDVSIFYADDFAVTESPLNQFRLKPDFDPILLAAQDYIGAPLFIRSQAFQVLDGLRLEAGTAACSDLLFRAYRAGISIARLPETLLAHSGKRVRATDKDYLRMLQFFRDGVRTSSAGLAPKSYLSGKSLQGSDLPVTIVIPTRRTAIPGAERSYIERLLEGIAQAEWPHSKLSVIVGDDITDDIPSWAEPIWPFQLERIETPRHPDEPFNYAAKMNTLWQKASSEQIILMNDDVTPLTSDWIKALQTFAVDEEIGGVGAKLQFESGELQHAGIAPFGGGVAHVWLNKRRQTGTYQDWALVQRCWSMVTGAVFATRKSLLEKVGGFDETFRLEFNDLDLCLRLGALGYRIAYNPAAAFVHTEKASRGEALPPAEEQARFFMRWRSWLDQDPAWHPRLRKDSLAMLPNVDSEIAWFM